MEILISNWSSVESLPESYVFPQDRRPGTESAPLYKDVPVIDLENASKGPLHRSETINQILKASEEFGFFQVINHGVAESLMDETMDVLKEFFRQPGEYKAGFYSNELDKSCRLYTSTLNYDKEQFHYWRDNLTHRCHPSLQHHIQSWPQKPENYRDVVGRYAVEARRFLLRILDVMGEGLGVESGYFHGELSQTQLLSVNHHIPCPDPSLTLGMPEHCDPNLISMLHQCRVPGLQVLRHGQWLGVEPLPHAFLVIPGLQLQVISNGRITSPKHRVVTDKKEARTTIGSFLIPSHDFVIKPAGVGAPIADRFNTRIYRPFTYREFFTTFTVKNCDADSALESFKITRA